MSQKQVHWHSENIATIDNFLTAEECQNYIELSENGGFDEAPITTQTGAVLRQDVRNNDRFILDDANTAASLWTNMEGVLDDPFRDRWQPIGLNERLRFYRYEGGQKFDWHKDGHFARDHDERSLLTFMLYLNEACVGGETLFMDTGYVGIDSMHSPNITHKIKPTTGTALIFLHGLLHKGDMVREGVKYVLRSDIMFRRLPF